MKLENLSQDLEHIGLSKKEALVYAYILQKGGAFPSKIAEATKLNRTTTYKILLDLSIKGLVNEIKKKNKIYYQIEKPRQLLRYAKDRVQIASDNLEKAHKLLPEIEGLYSLLQNKPRITYFEGLDGVMQVYEDHITTDTSYAMVAIANAHQLEEILPSKFFTKYRKEKERIGITTRGIITNSIENNTFTNRVYKGFKKHIVPHMKFVPDNRFPFKGEVTLYRDNKVSIINLTHDQLTGVIIEDQTIYNMIRTLFELSWQSLK